MRTLKYFGLAFLIVLVILQFFRPEKNIANGISETDISYALEMPADLHTLFREKCYDCHSNHTRYPWYFNIQPVAWWMADHIDHGKEELNFSEFKNYSDRKASHKLEEISELIKDDEMPLPSYTFIHRSARLTVEEKAAINSWIKSLGHSTTE